MNYEEIVKKVKVIARDVLRAKLVSARLSSIASFESHLKESERAIEKAEKDLARAEFRKGQILTDDPDFEDKTMKALDAIKEAKAHLTCATECFDSQKVTVKEAIADEKEGIEKITSGETLVSGEALACLTTELLLEYGKEQVKAL